MARCTQCGTDNPADSRFCVSCGTAMTPVGAATTMPTPGASDMQTYTQYATFWERVAAAIIDAVITGIAQGIVSKIGAGFAASLIGVAYYIYFTGSTGQTIGKKVLNIKVVKTDGSAVDYGTAALREIVGKFVSAIILGIGFLFPLWDERKQALHDKIASTLVVKAPS